MKKFFKGLFGLLWRHKILTIVCTLAIVVTGILFSVFFNMFVSGDGKYGDRLRGINKVAISSKDRKEV